MSKEFLNYGIRIASALLLGIGTGLFGETAGPIALMGVAGFWLVGPFICHVIEVICNRVDDKRVNTELFIKECRGFNENQI